MPFLLVLASLVAAPAVITPLASAIAIPVVQLADRPRGVSVADRSGTTLGVIETSLPDRVVLRVGIHKIQLPAAVFSKAAGRLTAPITAQQVEALMAQSSAYQQKLHPDPVGASAPKGFVEPRHVPSPANLVAK